jgi:hypothetical protein
MQRWLPGLAVLGSMLGLGALLGMAAGPRLWPAFLALALAGIATVAWLTHLRMRARRKPLRKGRDRRTSEGGQEFDLETDTSTDEQRWLM